VSPDGSEDFLGTAEARLLLLLLEKPNRILTREQLAGTSDLSPMDRSIDVRISRLRKRLNDDPHEPKLIKTVYGAGYLMSANVSWETA
jgi:DNA-binding response OmpR family regulator